MKKGPQLAAIHTHFNIYRNLNEAQEGEVTLGEQITAATRFLRWHERQVRVGEELLRKLMRAQEKESAGSPILEVAHVETTHTPALPAEGS